MADEAPRVGASRDRVDFLTDGVFAIVATLLVLEIDVPEIPDHHTQAELWRSLGDVAPSFAAFAFSFLTILVYWVNHESLSRVVTHYPYRLVWINLLVLFFISMIPFTTKFISEYPTEPAATGRGPTTILSLESGDIFGWSTVLPEGVASSTARAVLATEAVVFERESLTAMLATDCEVAGAVYGRILGAVARRLQATRLQLLDLYGRSGAEGYGEPW